MKTGIFICGLNGSGKSTVGLALAKALDYEYHDIEDYYFPDKSNDYVYGTSCSKNEVESALLIDLEAGSDFVLTSVRGNFKSEITSLISVIIVLEVPKGIRLQRVYDRSFSRFGNRILPCGDLHEQESRFFKAVELKNESIVSDWVESMNLPVTYVDGSKPVDVVCRDILIGIGSYH